MQFVHVKHMAESERCIKPFWIQKSQTIKIHIL